MLISLAGEVHLPTVEHRVKAAGVQFATHETSGWQLDGQTASVVFDFSKSTFVHFAALGLLVGIVKALADQSVDVEIRLPESASVGSWLAYTQFMDVCETASDVSTPTISGARWPAPDQYLGFLPLRWISITDRHRYDSWLRETLRHPSGGTNAATDDALTIATSITGELLDNVFRHSGAERALVGAFAQPSRHVHRDTDYYETEVSDLDYMNSPHGPALQLVVMDTGVGVGATLARSSGLSELDGLAFAFDRWSSTFDDSAERGTRGLYRIARIVNRHRGFTTLRSGDGAATVSASALARHGSPLRAGTAQTFPGTLLRIQFPLAEPLLAIADAPTNYAERVIRIHPAREGPTTREELKKQITQSRTAEAFLVIDASGIEPGADSARRFLTDVVDLAHPGPTIVDGLSLSDYDIDQQCDAVANLLTREGRREFESVLVTGSALDRFFWISSMADTRDHEILQRLSQFDTRDAQSLRPVRTGWAQRLSPGAARNSFRRELANAARKAVYFAPQGMSLVTPSLNHVRGWIDMSRFLESAPSLPMTVAKLMVANLRDEVHELMHDGCHILYEDGFPRELIDSVHSSLQGGVSGQGYSAAAVTSSDLSSHRPIPFVGKRELVVVVRAISDGNSARRIAAYAARQGFRVHGVLGVFDTRQRPEPLRLWGTDLPTFSAVHEPLQVRKPSRGKVHIDRNGGREARAVANDYAIPRRLLLKHLAREQALSVGHFDGSRDRHYTFAVNAHRLLSSAQVMDLARGRIAAAYSKMFAGHPAGHAAFVLPRDPDPNAIEFVRRVVEAGPFANADVLTLEEAADRPDSTPFVLATWGSVTGESLLTAVRHIAEAGAGRVLSVTFLSQLGREVENNLRSIQQVGGRRASAVVRFEFLATLPISGYSQRVCPACTQSSLALDQGALARNQSFVEFVLDRLSLTSLRAGPTRVDTDPFLRIFGGRADFVATEALRRRIDVGEAAASTRRADEVGTNWQQQLERGDVHYVQGLASLIVHEPQWLREPPLNRNVVRGALADGLIDAVSNNSARHSVARSLVALRMLSKDRFIQALPDIASHVSGDSSLEHLVHDLAWSVAERSYLRGTKVYRELSSALRQAQDRLREAGDQPGGAAFRRLRYEVDERDSADFPKRDRTSDIIVRIEDTVARFNNHYLDMAWNKLQPRTIEDLGSAAVDWDAIADWVRLNLSADVRELRRHLELSNVINKAALIEMFPDKPSESSIELVREALWSAHSSRSRMTPTDWDLYKRTSRLLREMLLPPTAVPNGLSGAIPLQAALSGCVISAGRFESALARDVKAAGGMHFRNTLSDAEAKILLALPTDYVRLLRTGVVQNTTEAATGTPTIEVFAKRHGGGVVLTIRSHGVRSRPRADTTRAGHFGELDDLAVPGVGPVAGLERSSTAQFDTVVTVSEYRHE